MRDTHFMFSIFLKLCRIDVCQRDVPWSAAKQLMSVVETECSTDDIFDSLVDAVDLLWSDLVDGLSETIQKATGSRYPLFRVTNTSTATFVWYREIPFPWYVVCSASSIGAFAANLPQESFQSGR